MTFYQTSVLLKGIHHYFRLWSGFRWKFITTVVPNVLCFWNFYGVIVIYLTKFRFSGSCEYPLNKSTQKTWIFFSCFLKIWVAHEHTRRIGAICGYQNNTKSLCFQKPLDNETSSSKTWPEFLICCRKHL